VGEQCPYKKTHATATWPSSACLLSLLPAHPTRHPPNPQGIVDESNPYDKLQVTVTLPSNDPMFKAKRAKLDSAGLSTMQVGGRVWGGGEVG
jgi:hypothetical protein